MYDEQESREVAPESAALEQHLRGMAPMAPRVDRDRLMFAAGQVAATAGTGQGSRAMYDRAGRPLHVAGGSWAEHRFWPAATFAMTAAALLLATMLVWKYRSQPVVQITASRPPAEKLVGSPNRTETDQTNRFIARDVWTSTPPASSGYLRIRYVALTRDTSDFPLDYQSPDSNAETSAGSDDKPVTARGLLDELLPARSRSHQSRS